jgi:putative ABC transport system substrate-binding protein
MKALCIRVLGLILSVIVFNCEKRHPAVINIGVINLLQHPSLTLLFDSFKEELEKSTKDWKKSFRFIERNALGDMKLLTSLSEDILSKKPDIILSITTPASQAIVNAIKKANMKIPVVFAAVTDPVGAGIVSSLNSPESLITGVSDAWPIESQVTLIRKIMPHIKRIGIIYNPGEPPGLFSAKKGKEVAELYGIEVVEGVVGSTIDVYPVAKSLLPAVDALYTAFDNTTIGGVSGAIKACIENKKPVFVGEGGTVQQGGVATISISYADIGKKAAHLLLRLLKGERSIPIQFGAGEDIYINLEAARLMGVTIPEEVLRDAKYIFNTIK